MEMESLAYHHVQVHNMKIQALGPVKLVIVLAQHVQAHYRQIVLHVRMLCSSSKVELVKLHATMVTTIVTKFVILVTLPVQHALIH